MDLLHKHGTTTISNGLLTPTSGGTEAEVLEDMCSKSEHSDYSDGTLETPLSPAASQRSVARNHVCSECNKAFTKACRLVEHYRTHTGERPFVCQFPGCGKSYMRDTHLAVHARKHSESQARRYSCTVPGCTRGFSTNQHLKRHMAVHSSEKPYACTFDGCMRRFSKRNQLHVHQCLHTGENPQVCDHPGCTQSFKYPSQLRKHRLTHSQSLRYCCGVPDCSAQFSKWSELQAHRKIHKPTSYTCDICGAKFAKSHSLKVHALRHDPDRLVFACPHDGCGRFYIDGNALKAHVRAVHSNRPRFVCPHSECDRSYAYAHSLRAHVQKTHQTCGSNGKASESLHQPDKNSQSSDSAVQKPPKRRPNALEIASGMAYDDPEISGRYMVCPEQGCAFRFKRQTALDCHIIAAHSPATDTEDS
ncbi:hypothetical protein H4R20_003443 [Coemansia guatemalensis]|uniref:C2H2-type domain-containing protein n=1 Tax=Coemansia guatemalensis TaxID=2761395 RepID=A0A9W8LSN6_9FUNG|nr:hypothetical protein H4R20_003443 [Coemansia guatemalensis]